MFYTFDRCKRAWDEEAELSFLGSSYSDFEHWGEYWSYLSASYPDGSSGYQKKIIDYLVAEGILSPGNTVMDIGCGPGTYSLGFIREGASLVECIDSTKGMLEQLTIRAANENMGDCIHTTLSPWEDYDKNGKYDLVFSSMSPAIMKCSDLMKMEQHSNGKCALVTYAAGMTKTIRSCIWDRFLGKESKSGIFDAIYPFNLLYSQGRNPNMKIFTETVESRIPVEKAVENTERYFKIFGRDKKEDRRIIREVIEEGAQEGILVETIVGNYGLIWWEWKKN